MKFSFSGNAKLIQSVLSHISCLDVTITRWSNLISNLKDKKKATAVVEIDGIGVPEGSISMDIERIMMEAAHLLRAQFPDKTVYVRFGYDERGFWAAVVRCSDDTVLSESNFCLNPKDALFGALHDFETIKDCVD